jgi:predicted sugar kinase
MTFTKLWLFLTLPQGAICIAWSGEAGGVLGNAFVNRAATDKRREYAAMGKTETILFRPGENLTIRPEWKRFALTRYRKAVIRAPGRVHMNVFDFSKMAPGLGGGGLGISVGTVSSEVEISVDGHADPLAPSAQHILELFKQCVGYDRDDLRIRVRRRIEHAHAGLGSNVTFNTAVVAGLNALFGSPFSVGEMWDLLTHNYIENARDGKHVYFGLDTGVGEACVLYGGLVWIDEGPAVGHGRFLGSIPTDNLWVVTGVGDPKKLVLDSMRSQGQLGEKAEAEFVASVCQKYQAEYGPGLRQLLEGQLRPALLRNDFRGLLNAAWKLNDIGNMRVLSEFYRPEILQGLVDAMQQAGSLFAGMSSAGPGIFAFAENEAHARQLCALIEDDFGEYYGQLSIGRAGTKLAIELFDTSTSSHRKPSPREDESPSLSLQLGGGGAT